MGLGMPGPLGADTHRAGFSFSRACRNLVPVRVSFLALLVAASASAQVYTWTDKQGVTHFTDNPNSVPANVKAKITEGDEISTIVLPDVKKEAPKDEVVAGKAQPKPADDPEAFERTWRAAFRDINERIARLEDEIELDRHKVEDVNGLPVAARYQCLYGYGVWPPAIGIGSGVTVAAGGSGQVAPGVGVGASVSFRQNTFVAPYSPIATAPCVFTLNPEHERAKERLALNRKALERAKAELAELDRRASFEGVPREWRR